MNEVKRSKLKKFMQDEVMAQAVYEVLLDSFLTERRNQDVYVLAASRLAVDYLKQGMKELDRYKEDEAIREKILNQVGL